MADNMADNMADKLAQARHHLAVANRIVADEGIIDAFGHVSMRHPTEPDRYLDFALVFARGGRGVRHL